MKTITADEVLAKLETSSFPIVDVREDFEFAAGHIPGAINIPLGEIEERIGELDRNREIVLVCRSGARSGVACNFLQHMGYDVTNMIDGMLSWSGEVEYEEQSW